MYILFPLSNKSAICWCHQSCVCTTARETFTNIYRGRFSILIFLCKNWQKKKMKEKLWLVQTCTFAILAKGISFFNNTPCNNTHVFTTAALCHANFVVFSQNLASLWMFLLRLCVRVMRCSSPGIRLVLQLSIQSQRREASASRESTTQPSGSFQPLYPVDSTITSPYKRRAATVTACPAVPSSSKPVYYFSLCLVYFYAGFWKQMKDLYN